MTSSRLEWVGVDIGGSGARLWRVRLDEATSSWTTEGQCASFLWPQTDWKPAPLRDQLAQAPCPITSMEADAAEVRLELLCSHIYDVLAGRTASVAIAAPGLRDSCSRGLIAVRNGPRQPALLDQIEARLGLRHTFLCGDSTAGAAGEAYGRDGGFRGVSNGFYLGGGTGLAEALWVHGEIRELSPPWRKAWQRGPKGKVWEDELSPYRMNLEASMKTPAGALDCDRVLARLAGYIQQRKEEFQTNEGVPLERVVVAQGLARILANASMPESDWAQSTHLSLLRAAPALGAVALASQHKTR